MSRNELCSIDDIPQTASAGGGNFAVDEIGQG